MNMLLLSLTDILRHVLATDLTPKRQQTTSMVKREEGDFTASLVLNKNGVLSFGKENKYDSLDIANGLTS
jgi:hypothetical protein